MNNQLEASGRDLRLSLYNMKIALENAQDCCDEALEELRKLKVKNSEEVISTMKAFDNLIQNFGGR